MKSFMARGLWVRTRGRGEVGVSIGGLGEVREVYRTIFNHKTKLLSQGINVKDFDTNYGLNLAVGGGKTDCEQARLYCVDIC